ncbi:MAG: 4-hydroxythreonine-4-phosphate dehydrogenase PdxA [Gemmatimonadales bacterium]
MARPVAVTLGDPRGIGPEIVNKALAHVSSDLELIVVGPEGVQSAPVDPVPQSMSPAEAGRYVGASVEHAVALALAGEIAGIVTGPAEKKALHEAGYTYPGHTEWLGHLAGDVEVAMMLTVDALRVVMVTTHLPLREVADAVTTERVVTTGRLAQDALHNWWGLEEVRLAVCALNPHAGEGGLFGDEDDLVLRPAAAQLGAVGPLSADTVFVRALRGEFDAVITPTHDVGMTAVKVAGFGGGVNVTLGLPFVRTAPDHGTAFDIAGKGVADAGSMQSAIELAVQLSSH